MKLYLSSYRIPAPQALSALMGKPLRDVSVALIPNAKDYYSQRARDLKVGSLVDYMRELGLRVAVVDLRDYTEPQVLRKKLQEHRLIWAMGGNTYMLRYEMRRSGFEKIIAELLTDGMVYGGDSAGALVAGQSIAGVELADEPEFAPELITDGLGLVPCVLLPHVDNPQFATVLPVFRETHQGKHDVIALKDSQAVIYDGKKHWVVEAEGASTEPHHVSSAQLAQKLTQATQEVTVGARYIHYKQRAYTVVAVALREEDQEPCVIYQATYGDKLTWIRPVAHWTEQVEVDGKQVQRFVQA